MQQRQPETSFSFSRYAIRTFRKNRGAMLGLFMFCLLVTAAVLAPYISPYDPYDISDARLSPPSLKHPFGTDPIGRDVFTRIVYGGRISLQVGVISVSIAAVGGITLGLIAGYYEGWLDHIIMRVIEIMLAFPGILLAMAIMVILGSSLRNLMVAVGIGSIPGYTRLVRGVTLSVKQNEYIQAARAVGGSTIWIMLRHLLPNILAPILVLATLGVAGAILACAGLSFIGLGPPPPTAEWGSMLASDRAYMRTAWWLVAFPGIAITISVLSINLIGDGLRDALDPRLR